MKTMLAVVTMACMAQTPGYRAEVEVFRAQREAEIGGATGWAALAGLHWLAPGAHSVGRGASNDVVLTAPSAPARIGILTVKTDTAMLEVSPGVTATAGGRSLQTIELRLDTPVSEAVVIGRMTMGLIRRGGRLALRVWDSQSPGRLAFHGLRWMPVDPKWRVEGTFLPHTPAPRLRILNVLNDVVDMVNPGVVEFKAGGQTVRIEALLESDSDPTLFFMFKDATSGKTTYGAGRYLYADAPVNGHVVLDFNKAMNPPCTFTSFATCPLPPPANRLGIAIQAGELDHPH